MGEVCAAYKKRRRGPFGMRSARAGQSASEFVSQLAIAGCGSDSFVGRQRASQTVASSFQSDGCFIVRQTVVSSVPVRRLLCWFQSDGRSWHTCFLGVMSTGVQACLRVGAGNGQGMLTHFRTLLFDGRLLFGKRDDLSSPLNDLLGTLVCV